MLSNRQQCKPAYNRLFRYFPSYSQHSPCYPKCRSAVFWRQLLRLPQAPDRFLKKRRIGKGLSRKYSRFWKFLLSCWFPRVAFQIPRYHVCISFQSVNLLQTTYQDFRPRDFSRAFCGWQFSFSRDWFQLRVRWLKYNHIRCKHTIKDKRDAMTHRLSGQTDWSTLRW